jgi:hypothetical protein
LTIHHLLFFIALLLQWTAVTYCQQQDTLIAPGDKVPESTEKFLPVADTVVTTAGKFLPANDTVLVTADTVLTTSNTDSSKVHSPRKASIYSAVIPGLGQIYNRKYWKVPIVYLGFGVCAGSTIYNIRNYSHYKAKYIYMLENNLQVYKDQSITEVKWYKNTHRRYRDLWVIISAGFYALQIVDASVDAHLFDFDVSDDLSLFVDPVLSPFEPGGYTLGISCCLYF